MRSFTRSWIAYLLLFILTVAFAIWGIKDVFRNVGAANLVEIGRHSISPPQLSRELDLTLEGQRDQNPQQPTPTREEAIAQGLHLRILESMIARIALLSYGERLGVGASDVQVAERIRGIPAVVNPMTGSFDQTAYNAFLQHLHYGRAEFEEDMRGDIIRQSLADALTSGVRAPASYGELLYTYGAETRVVSVAMAMANTVGAIPAPTQAQLQTFWEDNQDALRVPEYRHVTLIYARASDFVPRANVTEQQIRDEFEQRRASLSQPERRTDVRIAAANQTQANQAAERINHGETPQAVATALHLQITNGTDEARTDVPDSRVAEAIFGMPAHAPARVVQGQLTPWAVVRVDSITPAVEPNYAAARDQIRQALAADQASDLLNNAVSAFEDARSAGTPAAQAAQAQGFAVVSVPAVDAQGRDPQHQPVAALAGQQELLRTAFQTPQGEASDFIPVTDADVVVATEGITPSRVRSIDEARGELTAAWTQREQVRRLREKGEQLIAAVHGGQSFAAATSAAHFQLVLRSQSMTRRDATQIPARGLPSQIFAANQGDVLSDIRADSGAVLVAVVERVNRPDLAAAPQQVEAARAQMEQSLQSSFAEAMTGQIVADAHPRRNEQLLTSAFQSTTDANQDEQ